MVLLDENLEVSLLLIVKSPEEKEDSLLNSIQLHWFHHPCHIKREPYQLVIYESSAFSADINKIVHPQERLSCR